MPLAKLWKTFTGRGGSGVVNAATMSETMPSGKANAEPRTSASSRPTRSRPVRRKRVATSSLVPDDAVVVLDIGIGDGRRTVETLEELAGRSFAGKYLVIDPFETASDPESAPLTLRQFHRMTAKSPVRPQVFPQPFEAALSRIAHTIGGVDLILMGDPPGRLDRNAATAALLKVAHQTTTLIDLGGENPTRHELSGIAVRMASLESRAA